MSAAKHTTGYQIEQSDDSTINLKLNEIIDETTTFPMTFDFSIIQNLHIDCDHIQLLNSEGIKNWIVFSDYLSFFKNLSVFYHRCNRLVIDQVNKTQNFIPNNGKVVSLKFPIFCESCEASFEVFQEVDSLNTNKEELIQQVSVPSCKEFPVCKKKWDLDFYENEFLSFLKR